MIQWVGMRKGNLKFYTSESTEALKIYNFFFCKINCRMFMQLLWTLYHLNVTNLSECYNSNEI